MDPMAKASILSVLQCMFNQLEFNDGVGVGTPVLKFISRASLLQQDVNAFVNQQLRPQLWTSIPVANWPSLAFDNFPWLLLIKLNNGAMTIGNPKPFPSQLNLNYVPVPRLYRLQSVIVEEGAVNPKQFFAYLRAENNANQWIDDEGVSVASTKDEALGANNASMLFYILEEREG
ncbi:hypothetical protein Ancab_010527 [Ancistrocladus abbreviatus]